MLFEEKIIALGLNLPEAPKPVAAYVPSVRSGNLIFTSGQLPFVQGELKYVGKLGDKETFAIVPHIPGGIILDSNYLRKIADVADKYHAKALKLTSAQRIAIVGIAEGDIDNAWLDLGMDKGNAIGLCVRSIKICPGTTFCKRAQQDSVSLGLELDKKYHGMQLPSKFKMGVSGCPNSCAENSVKDIGIQGTVKGWNVMIGGNAGVKPRLADVIAKELTSEEALALADKVIKVYEANANKFERMSRLIERIGIEEFKALLAAI